MSAIGGLKIVKLFAQNAEQMHIVNHLKRCPTEEKGNVLEESARRAHGDTRDLADLHVSVPDAVSMPEKMISMIQSFEEL
ncbi:Glutamine amidotransferase-like class 1 domain-containing protein 3A, mitochondrial [Manis javanica]|nr:Glutamine amidotransferase-like class 1 domain-containing protein 3A, mitochondrial [Manis javanica]